MEMVLREQTSVPFAKHIFAVVVAPGVVYKGSRLCRYKTVHVDDHRAATA
jgi:hypothetical protein